MLEKDIGEYILGYMAIFATVDETLKATDQE